MKHDSIKKNAFFNIIKTGTTILFPLITFPYISRVLLVENVGKINFGLSVVSYFSLISTLGITAYAIRECSIRRDNKEQLESVASQFYSISICTTVVAYVAMALALLLFRKLEGYRVLIVIQSSSIIANTLAADWINSAMEDYKYLSIRTVLFQLLSLILMFVFVRKQDDYLKYALISVLSTSGAGLVNIWYRKKYCRVRFIPNLIHGIDWETHFKPIVYMFVMIMAQTIFNSVDSTMLGIIHGDREVGIYSAAYKILNILNQVISSLVWVVMPRLAESFGKHDYESINVLLRKVLGYYVAIGLPCVVGIVVTAEDVVLVVSGKEFLPAVQVLRIMMIGLSISIFGGNFLGNTILLPSKQEKYYMFACCIMAIFNIFANLFFIPRYGANGAAFTTMLCSALMLVVLLFRIDKRIKIGQKWKLLLAPVIGCIAIVIVCFCAKTICILWVRLVVSIFSSIVLYALVLVLFKNELMLEMLEVITKHRKKDLDINQ